MIAARMMVFRKILHTLVQFRTRYCSHSAAVLIHTSAAGFPHIGSGVGVPRRRRATRHALRLKLDHPIGQATTQIESNQSTLDQDATVSCPAHDRHVISSRQNRQARWAIRRLEGQGQLHLHEIQKCARRAGSRKAPPQVATGSHRLLAAARIRASIVAALRMTFAEPLSAISPLLILRENSSACSWY